MNQEGETGHPPPACIAVTQGGCQKGSEGARERWGGRKGGKRRERRRETGQTEEDWRGGRSQGREQEISH